MEAGARRCQPSSRDMSRACVLLGWRVLWRRPPPRDRARVGSHRRGWCVLCPGIELGSARLSGWRVLLPRIEHRLAPSPRVARPPPQDRRVILHPGIDCKSPAPPHARSPSARQVSGSSPDVGPPPRASPELECRPRRSALSCSHGARRGPIWTMSREIEKVVVIVGPTYWGNCPFIRGEMSKILMDMRERAIEDCWRRKMLREML